MKTMRVKGFKGWPLEMSFKFVAIQAGFRRETFSPRQIDFGLGVGDVEVFLDGQLLANPGLMLDCKRIGRKIHNRSNQDSLVKFLVVVQVL